jgi:hypothetical protein
MSRRLLWLAVYAVAMAFLEAAVVVYLRVICYTHGFAFPLVVIPAPMALIEIAREAATIVMILAVAVLAAADRWGAFLLFAWIFGVWDIFYYVWLRVMLGWPPSLLTPDILFLIPVPWVGPVLAPLIVSVGLVVGVLLILRIGGPGATARFRPAEQALAAAGGVVVLLSFTLDARGVAAGGQAPPFRWGLFGVGMALGAGAVLAGLRRIRGIMKTGGRA